MTPSESRTFAIKSDYVWVMRVAVGLLALIGIASLITPANRIEFYAFGVFFLGLAVLGYLNIRQLGRAAVSIDRDGLWPAHLPKDSSLVRWEEIRSLRERQFLQRLELLDGLGRSRLNLEYQLAGFEELRSLVLARAGLAIQPSASTVRFRKNVGHHLIVLAVVVGFTLLGLYVGPNQPLLGYIVPPLVVCIILIDYLTTVSWLVIAPNQLQVGYPFRRRVVRQDDVVGIDLHDEFVKGMRMPGVKISLRDKRKPIKMRFAIDAVHLYELLRRWKESKSGF